MYIVGYEYWNSLFELSTVFMVMMFTDIFFTEAMLFGQLGNALNLNIKVLLLLH